MTVEGERRQFSAIFLLQMLLPEITLVVIMVSAAIFRRIVVLVLFEFILHSEKKEETVLHQKMYLAHNKIM